MPGGSGVWRREAGAWMNDLTTQQPSDIEDTIRRVLERNRLAVLATQRDGQPHASLIAFTPLEGLRFLAFATYRDTRKYASIQLERRVAILVEDRERDARHPGRRIVLTAVGEAIKTPEEERQAYMATHLARHPDLQKFLSSPECEFLRVAVHAYQVVSGVDDVRWYEVAGSAAT
jgi:nitroimidazol reductase NimA-like FMN-containing flavoprotein (pyridoxamine 5'-phosphate oxidase superfamily)